MTVPHQVIRQPDGLLAVWSAGVLVFRGATAEEVAGHFAEQARAKAEAEWLASLRRVDREAAEGIANRRAWDAHARTRASWLALCERAEDP